LWLQPGAAVPAPSSGEGARRLDLRHGHTGHVSVDLAHGREVPRRRARHLPHPGHWGDVCPYATTRPRSTTEPAESAGSDRSRHIAATTGERQALWHTEAEPWSAEAESQRCSQRKTSIGYVACATRVPASSG